ncbi:MAG: acyl carrier protein [Acidobacteriaceae bacterium]|nr:acyl carrier protein [Acidobacteriaceae bacterium]MBV8571818.1 acyl carrier protein [Acidobacteriaceae bacterium]
MVETVDVEAGIRKIVCGISGIPEDANAQADLYLDLGMASVHALQLLTELEDHFGIQIPDDDFVEATSIGKLIALVEKLSKN